METSIKKGLGRVFEVSLIFSPRIELHPGVVHCIRVHVHLSENVGLASSSFHALRLGFSLTFRDDSLYSSGCYNDPLGYFLYSSPFSVFRTFV